MNNSNEQLYRYVWGNENDAVGRFRREHYKNRLCRLIAKGKMNSCLVEFTGSKKRICCSCNALRKAD